MSGGQSLFRRAAGISGQSALSLKDPTTDWRLSLLLLLPFALRCSLTTTTSSTTALSLPFFAPPVHSLPRVLLALFGRIFALSHYRRLRSATAHRFDQLVRPQQSPERQAISITSSARCLAS